MARDALSLPRFEELFGHPPAVKARAPGRVNLIGEHTDYNRGFVLPIATPQDTLVELSPRDDDAVRLWSADVPEAERHAAFVVGQEVRRGTWDDYAAGVTASLREHGRAVRGFDARVQGGLPLGGGLSSSASFEVALLRALDAAFHLGLDPVTLARIGQRAETGLVGAPVGIMDQMAASLADAHAALFLDTDTLEFERLPLPASTALIVIHSGVTHAHAGGEYRTRRQECDEAARCLRAGSLREVSAEQLTRAALPAPLDRRARHVVTENDRVLRARDALRAGDAHALGTLMSSSHRSMREDFEISTPEIDTLVRLAQGEAGVFGARLTGGGFGGSIVALASAGVAAAAADRIAEDYARRVSRSPSVLIPPR